MEASIGSVGKCCSVQNGCKDSCGKRFEEPLKLAKFVIYIFHIKQMNQISTQVI